MESIGMDIRTYIDKNLKQNDFSQRKEWTAEDTFKEWVEVYGYEAASVEITDEGEVQYRPLTDKMPDPSMLTIERVTEASSMGEQELLRLSVNGKLFSPGVFPDWFVSHEFERIACGCGIDGCAGREVLVRRAGNYVLWFGDIGARNGDGMPPGEVLCFRLDDYLKACQSLRLNEIPIINEEELEIIASSTSPRTNIEWIKALICS